MVLRDDEDRRERLGREKVKHVVANGCSWLAEEIFEELGSPSIMILVVVMVLSDECISEMTTEILFQALSWTKLCNRLLQSSDW
jgi:hypothetical protein